MLIAPYQPKDRAACLGLFDSNVPRFFGPEEREEFARFLDTLPGPYLIGRLEGAVVACGGYAERVNQPGVWMLCWGMVEARLHGRGLGGALLRARLQAAGREPGLIQIQLNTSQHTAGFFERFGFAVTAVVANGFGPGLDRYAMTTRRGG